MVPTSSSTVPLGSVTTYEHCICISDGFTNPLVFPAPEPPTIRIFLFLSYFGCSGLVILSHSVAVSGMLFHLTGSVYGSKSLSVPHFAEPYSSLGRNCLAFFFLEFMKSLNATPAPIPQISGVSLNEGAKYGLTWNISENALTHLSSISPPSADTTACTYLFIT